MKVGIVGAGGVGGYFDGRLALAGTDVALLARGGHLTALRQRGLRVRGVADTVGEVALVARTERA